MSPAHTNTHKVSGWPSAKDYLRKPAASQMGVPPKAATLKTVTGAKKGKPA